MGTQCSGMKYRANRMRITALRVRTEWTARLIICCSGAQADVIHARTKLIRTLAALDEKLEQTNRNVCPGQLFYANRKKSTIFPGRLPHFGTRVRKVVPKHRSFLTIVDNMYNAACVAGIPVDAR